MSRRNGKTYHRILQTVQIIQEALLQRGFHILRYESKSSRSIYLKLDYGVCYSIRISDHPGKEHLKYRFNVRTDINRTHIKTKHGYRRHYYPIDAVEQLVLDILKEREVKITQYGEDRYDKFKVINGNSNEGKKGFWSMAYEVKPIRPEPKPIKPFDLTEEDLEDDS